jgi:hypothetical protein
MATRSTIALEFADGTVGQVYCHWDGYLAHNGKMLKEYYSNPFILRDLIDLGDISSLAPTIGTKHPFSHYDTGMSLSEFNNQYDDMTTFYGRDRDDKGCEARYYNDINDYFNKCEHQEYDYILRNIDGKAVWFVCDHDGAFVTLESAIKDEEDRIAQEEKEELPL